jgi:hypothetical protein
VIGPDLNYDDVYLATNRAANTFNQNHTDCQAIPDIQTTTDSNGREWYTGYLIIVPNPSPSASI